jgi:acyl-homoserine lactone acylase PvdQ
MRLIVDFADTDKSLHVLPTGESGQIRSSNNADQIPLYLSGQYHPAWPNRQGAEKNSRGILVLSPE